MPPKNSLANPTQFSSLQNRHLLFYFYEKDHQFYYILEYIYYI